ncbi:hypothetical protein AMS68_005374 [Peltaster fructicola]|uniref:Uncharacterized protein n=1 Tax=Peltaster fructicola TaxID=286661 RepID=A0A6H0XYN5_9PEZI|nr:hypothetical protein AMS68_005374 [Peltaster fructicola]
MATARAPRPASQLCYGLFHHTVPIGEAESHRQHQSLHHKLPDEQHNDQDPSIDQAQEVSSVYHEHMDNQLHDERVSRLVGVLARTRLVP